MKHYEIATVLHPDLEIDLDAPLQKIEKIITDHKATVDKKDNWGKRKLAYRINGQDWGVFVFYQISAEPNQIASLEATLKITDEIMRYLIVSMEEQKRITKRKTNATPKKEQEEASTDNAPTQSTAKES